MVGSPVAHSLSPRIHAMFAGELGLPVDYGRMEPEGDDFEGLVRGFFADGGMGLNVTLPYKERAFALADSSSSGSQLARASNTLKAEGGGTVSSCNTDGPGLVIDLTRRNGVSLAGSSVLVIGAGGSAAGIINALVDAGPRSVRVVNRTESRAAELVSRASGTADKAGVELASGGLGSAGEGGPHDVAIHTTSAGHGADGIGIGAEALSGAGFAYDLSYGEAARPFLELAGEAGVGASSDGLGMLVEQAALSFAYWEGKMPSTDPVFEELSNR